MNMQVTNCVSREKFPGCGVRALQILVVRSAEEYPLPCALIGIKLFNLESEQWVGTALNLTLRELLVYISRLCEL